MTWKGSSCCAPHKFSGERGDLGSFWVGKGKYLCQEMLEQQRGGKGGHREFGTRKPLGARNWG